MASSIPSQRRAVDPFASYNSDSVNVLTRIVTHGENGLANAVSCDVLLDSTSNTKVIVQPGQVYKDDVWLDITAEHSVDFTDRDHYYNFDTGFDMSGFYYIVLQYVYQKSRPAPQAKIVILKPNQISVFENGNNWVFLKAVQVTGVGPFQVTSVLDADPTNPDNKRKYVKKYGGTETTLPSFNSETDISRMVYDRETDSFYFGLSNRWTAAGSGSGTIICDTRGFDVGDLVYISYDGKPALARASNSYFFSDGVVSFVNERGIIITSGKAENVQVESGQSIVPGDLIYLSKTEPGKIRSNPTLPTDQFVGRCIETINPSTVTIAYHRGEPNYNTNDIVNPACLLETTSLSGASWRTNGSSYYQDIDISSINKKNAVFTFWNNESEIKVIPDSIEFISNDIARIWSSDGTCDLNVFILGSNTQTCSGTTTLVLHEAIESGTGSDKWLVWEPTDSYTNNWGPSTNGATWGPDSESTIWSGPLEYPEEIDTTGIVYYHNIDISDIIGKEGAVLIRNTDTNRVIRTSWVKFENNNVLQVLTDDINTNIEVVVVGPGISEHDTIAYSKVLPAGVGTSSQSWRDHTQVDISNLGLDLWGPTSSPSTWSPGPSPATWSTLVVDPVYTGLYFQDIDISFFNNNFIVMEFYDVNTNRVVYPKYIQFINDDVIRVWNENTNQTLNVTIIGNQYEDDYVPPDSTSSILGEVTSLTPISLSSSNWISSGGLYYQEININNIDDRDAIITVINSTTEMFILPKEIEFVTDSIVKIWMETNTDDVRVFVIGRNSTPTNNTKVVTALASGTSWVPSLGLYYQDIDVSSIVTQDSAVMIRDISNQEVIFPEEIQFDSVGNLRIWMDNQSKTLEVIAAGRCTTNDYLNIKTEFLETSYWISSGGLYYQDIDIADIGEDIVLQIYDAITNKVIQPNGMEFIGSNSIRIWFDSNSRRLKVIIIG